MDAASMLSALGGNRKLLREMARLCLNEDAPRLRARLHAAAETGDMNAIESAAHALKGLVAEFRAEAARTAAAEIEAAARAGKTHGMIARIESFDREYQRLATVLHSIADELS